MNLNICEKCLKNKIVEYAVCSDKSIHFHTRDDKKLCCQVIDSIKKLPTNKWIRWSSKSLEGGIISVRVCDKACPYWLEHQMFDWNNKK